jgi:hypothetical protein
MSKLRERTQEHFPAVLLTLISIIQALALELLWGKITGTESLWQGDMVALVGWGMVSVSLLGILQIWIMYSFMVMGFVWLPGLRDSLFPFVIGLQEFMLVSLIGTEYEGLWLLVLASIFLSANIISHLSFRRARQEPANELFFRGRKPATLRDFRWAASVILALTVLGVVSAMVDSGSLLLLVAMTLANIVLLVQIFATRSLWRTIMSLSEN